MNTMKVSLNEIWALVKQHAVKNTKLPEINGNKKTSINGKEIYFYIDNEPILYYTIGKNKEKYKLYIDCLELYQWDEYDNQSSVPVVDRQSFEQVIKNKI